MIDLYEDGSVFVNENFYEFCADNNFSVRLFHRLRHFGLESGTEVIDFYRLEFKLEKYAPKWGKRTAAEFETAMKALLIQG
jgi:hypothetical protein